MVSEGRRYSVMRVSFDKQALIDAVLIYTLDEWT